MRCAVVLGCVGWPQRDPLNEFKSEAYRAFERLKVDLEHYIVDLAMRGLVQIEAPAPPAQALPRNLQTNAQALDAASGQTKSAGCLSRYRKPKATATAHARWEAFQAAAPRR